MRVPGLRFEVTRRHAWTAATLLLVVLLAAHPELRLLVPLVDAIGVDTLMLVFGLQLLDFARVVLGPLPMLARERFAGLAVALDRASERFAALRFPRDFARYAVFHWIDPRLWRWVNAWFLRLQHLPAPAFAR